MPNKFSSGKKSIAQCDRCGFRFKLAQLKTLVIKTKEVNIRVCPECWEPDHPQLKLGMYPVNDPQAVRNPRPDTTYPQSRAFIEQLYVGAGTALAVGALSDSDAYAIDATAAQIRTAILDLASYASGGWRLTGIAGARLNASARSSVAMQQTVSGAWEFAPHNLLLQSERFDDGAWAKDANRGSFVSNVTSPRGDATGQTLTAGTEGYGYAYRTVSGLSAGQTMAYTFYARAGTSNFTWFEMCGSTQSYVNLSTLAVSAASGVTITPVSVGAGWVRITATAAATAASHVFSLGGCDASGSQVMASGNTVQLWGANLAAGSAFTAYIPTTTAAVYGPAIDWLSGIGAYGLRSEEQRTNSIRNNTMVGAVAGTPGTLPTNWPFQAGGSGISVSIAGTGTESGVAYLDWRISGTATGNVSPTICFDRVAAATGQTWTTSSYIKLAAGSIAGVTNPTLSLIEETAATVFVTGALYSIPLPTSSSLISQRPSATRTLSGGATVALVRTNLTVDILSGSTVDCTIRIGLPQLEQGAFATSPILTYGAAATRAADTVGFTNVAWLSPTVGTFIGEAVRDAAATGNFPVIVRLSGTTGNRMILGYNTATLASFEVVNGGVNQATMYPPTTADIRRVAAVYAANDFAVCVNGGSVLVDGSGTVPSITSAWLGSDNGGSSTQINGHVTRVRYATRRLSNAELQEVTA